jgi:hypothetical protein
MGRMVAPNKEAKVFNSGIENRRMAWMLLDALLQQWITPGWMYLFKHRMNNESQEQSPSYRHRDYRYVAANEREAILYNTLLTRKLPK